MSGKRVDANHRQIVQTLRELGCSVLSLAPLGHGAPDLLIGLQGHSILVEIKTPTGRPNAAQRAFQAGWRGRYAIIRTVDEALLLREWIADLPVIPPEGAVF